MTYATEQHAAEAANAILRFDELQEENTELRVQVTNLVHGVFTDAKRAENLFGEVTQLRSEIRQAGNIDPALRDRMEDLISKIQYDAETLLESASRNLQLLTEVIEDARQIN